jgi:hypothetical protein
MLNFIRSKIRVNLNPRLLMTSHIGEGSYQPPTTQAIEKVGVDVANIMSELRFEQLKKLE